MLPYLEPKKMTSTIMASRKPSGAIESEGPEDEQDAGLMSAAEDLISAIHSKSAEAVASALKAAFDICGSSPESDGSSLFDSDGE